MNLAQFLKFLAAPFYPLFIHRQLILEMAKREILGRYRGSFLGIAWSSLYPLLMLGIYTFVFSYIFGARWGVPNESPIDFAIILFVGIIIHGFFSECLNRAPMLILSNPNYVKKIIFPLEVLVWSNIFVALFHTLISIFILITAQILFKGVFHLTILFFPAVFLPFVFLTAGISLTLASIGVFVRDAAYLVNILTTILLFLSPVFYSLEKLPENFHFLIKLNPLSIVIEQGRSALIYGSKLDVSELALYCLLSLIVLSLSQKWFSFTRNSFADVM